jgi:hypothetical protein
MKCTDVRELMPDLALGLAAASPEAGEHLRSCGECAQKLDEMRKTMAVLDEWQAAEPSPYFDTRLQARLRELKQEEQEKAASGFMLWIRKPVLAIAATILLAVGVTLFHGDFRQQQVANNDQQVMVQPGTAVGDLQTLDKNHDLYSDFDVLDDLTVQQDVNANP